MSVVRPTYPSLELLIDGEWTRGSGSENVPVLDPSTATVVGEVPLGVEKDFVAALDAADRTASAWRRTSPVRRSEILRGAAAIIRDRVDELAGLITLELGKPVAEAVAEAVVAAEHLEWAAEEGRRAYGRVIPGRTASSVQTARVEPIGIVAGFAPWNAPAITPARKIAYVLAAGCTMVFKPSEETPASALFIVRALEEAGLPAGVINVVFGEPSAISTLWLADARVKAVTFTGSTGVGRTLASLAAPSMKRTTLELGGHAPVVVTGDVDVASVAASAVRASFRNSGQICTSPTRFYVDASIHDEFAEAFAMAAAALVVGDPFDERTQMGPVANESRVHVMDDLTQEARSHGVDVRAGGERIDRDGSFWAPTVLVGVDDDRRIANVEPFGPMAALSPFRDLDEAVARANRLPWALASYVWTESLSAATRLMDEIDAGSVVVNRWQASLPETPFGGYDDSGIGTEGGTEALRAFQRIKYTAHG